MPRTPFSSLVMRCRESVKYWILSSWGAGRKSVLKSTGRREGGKKKKGSLGRQGRCCLPGRRPASHCVLRSEQIAQTQLGVGYGGKKLALQPEEIETDNEDLRLGGCLGTEWRRTVTARTRSSNAARTGPAGQGWIGISVRVSPPCSIPRSPTVPCTTQPLTQQ